VDIIMASLPAFFFPHPVRSLPTEPHPQTHGHRPINHLASILHSPFKSMTGAHPPIRHWVIGKKSFAGAGRVYSTSPPEHHPNRCIS
jgi:hypothetical protein